MILIISFFVSLIYTVLAVYTNTKLNALVAEQRVTIDLMRNQLKTRQIAVGDMTAFLKMYEGDIDYAARELINALAEDRDAWQRLYEQAVKSPSGARQPMATPVLRGGSGY